MKGLPDGRINIVILKKETTQKEKTEKEREKKWEYIIKK